MDLKLKVSAGASRKLNRQAYGGNAYESSDVWVSFEKEVPADADQSLVEATARHLQKMADKELEAEVKRVIQSIAPQKPPEAPRQDSSSVMKAPPRGCAHSKDVPCWPCAKAFKNGAIPAKSKEVVPDTPSGEPFPG